MAARFTFGWAQKAVYAFAGTHNLVHIRRRDQLPLQNTYPVTAEFRALAVLLTMSDKRLFIDSFAQHAAAALGLPSVVCWVANVPEQFGYEMHANIVANAPTLPPEMRNAVFRQYNIGGQVTEFPYRNEDEIFDADKIIEALKSAGSAQAADAKKNGVGEKSLAEL